jgi:tripartite-type tricarboxylate transporter receptor subunit TctC
VSRSQITGGMCEIRRKGEKFMWKSLSVKLLCVAVAALSATTAVAQTAASYPSKVVRIIVPFAPGGGTTPVARIFADRLAMSLGQSFIVDNRPGGNTTIGSQLMARAAPDGYTLLFVTNTHVINHWTQAKLPYDTFRDFAGISTLIRNNHMLVAHPAVPANSLKDFIAHLKKSGEGVNAAVTGVGSVNHLSTLIFMKLTGTKFNVVPYKGGGVAITDLLSGAVQMSINTVTTFAPHVKAGKLKGIAISGDNRNAVVPEVPTFTEGGMKGFVATNWYTLLAPARTPRDILQKLNGEIRRAQTDAEVIGLLAKQGVEPFPNGVAETQTVLRAELDRIGKVIKEFNIRPDTD